MGDNAPKDRKGNSKQRCLRCNGSKTETETYQEPMGGASREMITKQRQITCQVCHGEGYF